MKKLLTLAIIVSFLSAAAPTTSDMVGKKAPLFSIKTIMYNQFILNDELKKIKNEDGLIILDFFATWCIPCKKEFPIFEKIYKELEEKKIYFYAVSIDSRRIDLWNYIKKESKVTFNVLWDQNAFNAANDKKYKANSVLPQLFIIDKEGIIRSHHIGEIKNLEAVLKHEIEMIKPGTFPEFKDVKIEIGETSVKERDDSAKKETEK